MTIYRVRMQHTETKFIEVEAATAELAVVQAKASPHAAGFTAQDVESVLPDDSEEEPEFHDVFGSCESCGCPLLDEAFTTDGELYFCLECGEKWARDGAISAAIDALPD